MSAKVDVLAVMDRIAKVADDYLHTDYGNELREARSAVAELIEALKESRRELHACQAAIHLCGGFDPAYVTGAQASMKRTDAALANIGPQS